MSADIEIRPYQARDAAAFHEAACESVESLAPWMPWCHPGYTMEEAKAWVESQISAFAEGDEYEFVVVDGEGRLLGGCGINQIDWNHRRANLGYWVRSTEGGRGVAVEAVRQLVEWAFENTELDRLEVVVATGNARSLRVAEKAGAVHECVQRKRLVLRGVGHDAVMFSFVRE